MRLSLVLRLCLIFFSSFALTGDWLSARSASFGEQFTEAFGTVGFFVTTGETLASQRRRTFGACKAFAMPWFVLVRNTTGSDDLVMIYEKNIIVPIFVASNLYFNCAHQVTLDTTRGVFFLVTSGTVDFLFARNKRLGANGRLAYAARKTFLVPLTRLVLHLLGS